MAVCAPERFAVAHEEAAGAVWDKEPFVGIEHERIGAIEAGHPRAPALRQHEEAAVGSVHVKKKAFVLRDIRQSHQVIHGPGVRCAGMSDYQKGVEARVAVSANARSQEVDPDTELLV
jgi:hypothetical protein